MSKFQKIKKIWNVIVSEWKTHYRLVFSNEQTHEQRFVVKQLTIQKMVVISVLAAFVIIALTAVIIALTPLRMYIPGYTTQKDYKLYKQTAARIDSMEKVIEYNQKYIDNFTTMLAEQVPTSEEMDQDAEAMPVVHTTIRDKKRMAEAEGMVEESEMILARVNDNSSSSSNVPNIEQAKITSISLYPPAMGSVVRLFDLPSNHFGIDISSAKNTVVTSVANGVVIASNYDATDGYSIIVQHPGNMISIYKRNSKLLKKVGSRVSAGTPIAVVGNTGSKEGKTVHLHFELWYNGFPINPLDYLVIE